MIDRVRKLHVKCGNPFHGIGLQYHLDAIVDVEPLGMMIQFFRHQGDTGHKAERFVKVGKVIGLADRVAIRDLDPAV